MIKNLLILLLCLVLSSCAYSEYTGIYTNALKTKTTVAITKEGNYQELKERITGYFESRGYKNAIFVDQKKGFFVLAREGDFKEPCEIILKYTLKQGTNKVRIDLVKGSDDLVTDSQVSEDIEEIADQIKNH